MPYARRDWNRLEAEFVTGDMSIREMARREKLSPSTLARQARNRGNWLASREAYRASKMEKTYDLLADKDAIQFAARTERILNTLDEMLSIASDQIPVWKEQIAAGKTPIPVKDVLGIINQLRLVMGQPTERKEETHLGLNLHAFSPDQLERFERAARVGEPDAGATNGTVIGTAEVPSPD